jgi:predicted nuclease of predicted toxin-antitoxin system
MVKLLLDENFPAPAARRLGEYGVDVLAIRDACPGWLDEAVLALAVAEQRWIITFDRDYGDLVFKMSLPPPPAIVLLREPHYRPAEPADWVLSLLVQPDIYLGRFVVFTRDKVRVRAMLKAV